MTRCSTSTERALRRHTIAADDVMIPRPKSDSSCRLGMQNIILIYTTYSIASIRVEHSESQGRPSRHNYSDPSHTIHAAVLWLAQRQTNSHVRRRDDTCSLVICVSFIHVKCTAREIILSAGNLFYMFRHKWCFTL